MKAAVLHALGDAPRYEDFAEPTPDKDEALVSVRAASLKSSDKMMADGSHYDSLRRLPAVVGLDGMGLLEDGTRVYCGAPRPPYGTMAETTVVPRAFCLPVPDAVDDLTAAALPNPAMSSWLALSWRAKLEPGETVLILGATGVAGRLAVQVARHLGAGRVVGAGRNAEALAALAGLGADATIRLEGSDSELEEAFARQAGDGGYDVVLDYLWGRPTEALVAALTGHDLMAEPTRTRLVQIGEMAGPILRLPAEACAARAWRSWAAAAAASRRQPSSRRSRGCGSWPPRVSSASMSSRCPSLTCRRRGDAATWVAAGWCSSPEPGPVPPGSAVTGERVLARVRGIEHQPTDLAVGLLINRSNEPGSRPEGPRRRFFEV